MTAVRSRPPLAAEPATGASGRSRRRISAWVVIGVILVAVAACVVTRSVQNQRRENALAEADRSMRRVIDSDEVRSQLFQGGLLPLKHECRGNAALTIGRDTTEPEFTTTLTGALVRDGWQDAAEASDGLGRVVNAHRSFEGVEVTLRAETEYYGGLDAYLFAVLTVDGASSSECDAVDRR